MPQHTEGETLPTLVIGAGPVGLAAAARLSQEGRRFIVLESGARPGHAIRRWGHVRLFTPWRYLVDEVAGRMLRDSGWTMPDADGVPTGGELVDAYVAPLAMLPALAPHIRYGTRVVRVSRRGLDKVKTAGREEAPFDVRAEAADGTPLRFLASAVIDASGTYDSANPLGAGGLPAPGETSARPRVYYGLPDVRGRDRLLYAGKHVGVVGSGHSAFNTLLDLESLVEEDGTTVTWFVRSADLSRLWGGGEADSLGERGRLGMRMRGLAESGTIRVVTGFAIDELVADGSRVVLRSVDGRVSEPLDEIVAVTGFRPDLSLTQDLRLDLDSIVEAPKALAPLIDPNVHSCGTVPPHGFRELAHSEPGFYTVGMKSYGRAPTFLLLTGYEQVRSVVKALVGDITAAERVELCLPETGVCSTDTILATAAPAEAPCCGASSEDVDAADWATGEAEAAPAPNAP